MEEHLAEISNASSLAEVEIQGINSLRKTSRKWNSVYNGLKGVRWNYIVLF